MLRGHEHGRGTQVTTRLGHTDSATSKILALSHGNTNNKILFFKYNIIHIIDKILYLFQINK